MDRMGWEEHLSWEGPRARSHLEICHNVTEDWRSDDARWELAHEWEHANASIDHRAVNIEDAS